MRRPSLRARPQALIRWHHAGVSTRERILIVDDDAKVLNSLERGLRLSGFDTATAVDGRSALSSVNKQCPAALVLDVNMPGLDGVGW